MRNITYAMVFLFCAALGLPGQAAEDTCLKYEPTTIELTGIMKQVTFPGPPNYQSVREGDKPERCWVLYPQKTICVDGDPNNTINVAERNVKSLQLIINGYDKYRSLLGQKVRVKGELMHAITGHHHTSVLINVKEIRKAQQQNQPDRE
jgi:hypothetical protein